MKTALNNAETDKDGGGRRGAGGRRGSMRKSAECFHYGGRRVRSFTSSRVRGVVAQREAF